MNEIAITKTNLPDTIEDLTQFVLVGKATLEAYMIKLRKVNKLSVAREIKEQTLKDAQEVSTALIAAEQRIGELLLSIPSQAGRRTDIETSGHTHPEVKTKTETIKEMGYSERESKDYQQMAKNPEVVQKVIDEALANGDVVTKNSVMKEIKAFKDEKKIKDNFENGGDGDVTKNDGKKLCAKCNKYLPLDMFYENRNICKKCKSEYKKMWRMEKLGDEYEHINEIVESAKDDSREVESTLEYALIELNADTESYLYALDFTIKNNLDVVHNNKTVFKEKLDQVIKEIEKRKGML